MKPKITYTINKKPPLRVECRISMACGREVTAYIEECIVEGGLDMFVVAYTGSTGGEAIFPVDFRAYIIGLYGLGVAASALMEAHRAKMKTSLRRKRMAEALRFIRENTKKMLAANRVLVMCNEERKRQDT